ncbi:MerR family transcriptional regulator [Collinsella sp. An2]|uniref:MerR family transcriptional regulator n=1 Tax=Collinsella sp. An2 TaxID=1965585 RepID=UPI000B3905B7|nr:MerR family transcriptional regulator [Collinsella sp. An2]OUP08411.1 MerR family transcriptional regulator [Collinsella sp. An2]
MNRSYTIGELAELSGVSVRTLRFYEEAELLAPERDAQNGYRRYGRADVDRLQEILLLRRLGVAVRDIAPLLSASDGERRALLAKHLDALRDERRRLDGLIITVERSLAELEGGPTMADREKFEGFKRRLVDENERRYGAEARDRFGDAAVEESNRRMLHMSEADYTAWQELDAEIRAALTAAVRVGKDPTGPEGAHICDLHRRWLGYTWPSYSAEAHRALAESYVADGRFTAYYDREVPGCAAWLRDAVLAHA